MKFYCLFSLVSFGAVVLGDDVCQPITWSRKRQDTGVSEGDIICRYWTTTGASVNYYTCTQICDKYGTLIENFWTLNPDLSTDCSNIQPNTDYCVEGFIQPVIADDGFCGPQHNNASCLGTDAGQCCNSETWKCGDAADDCAAGTCYSGTCHGADEYAIDGLCGAQHGDLLCGGKWGDCCNNDGVCGTGTSFCSVGSCQSGNCTGGATTTTTTTTTTTGGVTLPTGSNPWLNGNTTDGTCGGAGSYTCNVVYGNCCGADGTCATDTDHCGDGCQPLFGSCGLEVVGSSVVTTFPSATTSASSSTTTSAA